MRKQNVTCRLDENVLTAMKFFCELKGIKMAKYIRRAVENQINEDYMEQSGGMLMEWPNPQLVAEETPETLEAVADAFDDLDRKLRRACPKMRVFFNTEKMSKFVEEKLLARNDDRREGMK